MITSVSANHVFMHARSVIGMTMDRVYGVIIFSLSLMALGAICSASSMVHSWKGKGSSASNPQGTLVSHHNAIIFETNIRRLALVLHN